MKFCSDNVSPLGSPGGTLTGVAGALLAPGLLAAAGDLGAGQSALGALTAVGQVVLDHLVDHSRVGLDAEHRIGELDLADLLAGHVKHICFSHDLHSPFLTCCGRKPSAGCGRKPSAG